MSGVASWIWSVIRSLPSIQAVQATCNQRGHGTTRRACSDPILDIILAPPNLPHPVQGCCDTHVAEHQIPKVTLIARSQKSLEGAPEVLVIWIRCRQKAYHYRHRRRCHSRCPYATHTGAWIGPGAMLRLRPSQYQSRLLFPNNHAVSSCMDDLTFP